MSLTHSHTHTYTVWSAVTLFTLAASSWYSYYHRKIKRQHHQAPQPCIACTCSGTDEDACTLCGSNNSSGSGSDNGSSGSGDGATGIVRGVCANVSCCDTYNCSGCCATNGRVTASSSSGCSTSSGSDKDKNSTDDIVQAKLPPSWRSGETIRFSQSGSSWDLLVERLPNSFLHSQQKYFEGIADGEVSSLCVSLARPSNPYQRLRVSNLESGSLDWGGRAGDKDCCWVVTTHRVSTSDSTVTLEHTSHSKKKGQGRSYSFALAAKGAGWVAQPLNITQPHVNGGATSDECAISVSPPMWHVEAIQKVHPLGLTSTDDLTNMSPWTDRTLTPVPVISDKDLKTFVLEGFLVLRQKVPSHILNAAKRSINSRLGQPGSFVPYIGNIDSAKRRPPSGFDEIELPLEIDEGNNDAPLFNGRMAVDASYDKDLLEPARCPEVHRYISQLLGTGQVAEINGVQVALRFPGEGNDVLVMSGAAMKNELKGDSWHTDGLRQGKKHSFSLLVGVALSDTLVPNNGNLCVWPRSHLHIHHWMRHPDGMIRRIPNDVEDRHGHPTGEIGYSECDMRSVEATNGEGYLDSDGALPDLGPPAQVLLKEGDIVFKHSEVGHCGAPHTGHDIRSMLYYRVRHSEWKSMHQSGAMVSDMWCDFPGVKHLVDATALRGGCRHPPAMNDCAHVGQVGKGVNENFVSMSHVDLEDIPPHSCL